MTENSLYHIKTYADKARAALAVMHENQRPDDEEGAEIDVLIEVRDDLKKAILSGYSAQQIADALKNASVFQVSIKEILEAAGVTAQALDTKQTKDQRDETTSEGAIAKGNALRARLGRPRKSVVSGVAVTVKSSPSGAKGKV